MSRAVIFDFDGVLNAVARDAAKVFFESRLPIPLHRLGARWELYLRSRCPTFDQAADLWREFVALVCDDFLLPAEVRSELLAFAYASLFEPYPDARPAAMEARRRGARVGVLSNMPFNNIDALLRQSNLMELVDAVLLPFIDGLRKPEPEVYLAIARRLDVRPEQCLYFDDENANVAGAVMVGMQGYLVDRARPAHDIRARVIRSLSAVPLLLDQDASAAAEEDRAGEPAQRIGAPLEER